MNRFQREMDSGFGGGVAESLESLRATIDLQGREIKFSLDRIEALTAIIAEKDRQLSEFNTNEQRRRETLKFYNDQAHEYAMKVAYLNKKIQMLESQIAS